MKIGDYLSKAQKQQLHDMTHLTPKKKQKNFQKKRKTEKVNWIEIMGMNRDRYGRGKGGAMRRK